MECVPVALACGHLIQGAGHYEIPDRDDADDAPARAECPEGCGWQTFVVEPGETDRCLCRPGRHVCGRVGPDVGFG